MNGQLRYGIIGVGMMGLEHLRNLLEVPGTAVVAAADPQPESLVRARTTMGDSPLECFDDHRSLLESGLCDAVVIASPNMTHADILLDVCDAGVPVLVEKPLCTTMADCLRLSGALEDYPRPLWVGLEYRYMPPVARLIDSVQQGDVGAVRMVAIREHRYPFLAKVGDWNRFNRNTGGTLVEKCCHFFDLMNFLTGAIPVRVFASGAQDVNHLDELYDGEQPDILDNALVIVDYANGTRAALDLCMFAEGTTNWEELSVVGDAGKVEAALPSGTFRRGLRDNGIGGVDEEIVEDPRIRHQGFHHGASYLEHLGFRDAVVNGTPVEVGLRDGVLSVAMGVAAHRSIDEARVVTMDEVFSG
ncbi:MAG: Gfo/Idh/MocA family protein [Acidimicrobiales bacterium]